MAGLILKIFNYEFLCFHTERNLREDARSSILNELDHHLLLSDFDYSQHEFPASDIHPVGDRSGVGTFESETLKEPVTNDSTA